jgi:hypothetical protein
VDDAESIFIGSGTYPVGSSFGRLVLWALALA